MADYAYDFGNGLATHQVILNEAVRRTTGPVIEFGCGEGSTVMLHEVCKEQNRRLVSVDNNPSWLSRYKEKYETDWYRFYQVSPVGCRGKYHDCNHWDPFIQTLVSSPIHWGVMFVDHAPRPFEH